MSSAKISSKLFAPFKPPIQGNVQNFETVRKRLMPLKLCPRSIDPSNHESGDKETPPNKAEITREVSTEKIARKLHLEEPVNEETPKKSIDKISIEDSSAVKTVVKKDELYYFVEYLRRVKRRSISKEDGILILSIKRIVLQDKDGKRILEVPNSSRLRSLADDSSIQLGLFSVKIKSRIPYNDYISGRCFFSHLFEPTVYSEHTFDLPAMPIPEGSLVLDAQKNVFVDKFLAKKLRSHQEEGVRFMYDCVSGSKGMNIFGCILADSMGLGKTLQTISLVYTLLKEDSGINMLKKAIIVTPATLLENWKLEISKWLGDRLVPLIFVGSKTQCKEILQQFKEESKLLIISYESFRKHSHKLECGLIICDEGHRLKNANCQTTKAFLELKCLRRILLTGTPLQNSLNEFYVCASIVNPGILGTVHTFSRLYAEPIIKGQDPSSSEKTKQLAWGRSEELSRITAHFMIRRTSLLLTKLLPTQHEFLIFIQMHPLQRNVYTSYLRSTHSHMKVESENSGKILALITDMRKIVNHPTLVHKEISPYNVLGKIRSAVQELFPANYKELDITETSYKFQFLYRLALDSQKARDKIVVVSNFTKTLDVIEKMCDQKNFSYFRLDGNTSIKKRLELVNLFNHNKNPLLFLLSSKAGGCGLNLIGANRLVLFDPDWNPSNDKQAMARVWREGQQKEVFIYRLISTGTLEEKIYQRQMVKEDLSSIIVDAVKGQTMFSKEYLKELFTMHDSCQTYKTGDQVSDTSINQSQFIDLVREIKPSVVAEDIEFLNSTEGEFYKQELNESE